MRIIFHVDMNAFYASCEQAHVVEYRGKPLLVAGDPAKRHGIILTASYEARKYGVRTGMPVWLAKTLCPDAVFVPPDFELYMSFSRGMINILRSYSPLVEQFSIDEAWLDATGCEKLFGRPVEMAAKIQKRMLDELNLPCSIGISENKLLSKMASDIKKPLGLTELYQKDVPDKMWPLPVKDMIWIGRRREEDLKNIGVFTIGDLAAVPVSLLQNLFGINGKFIHYLANGYDESPVRPDFNIIKSFGNSVTLPKDYTDINKIKKVFLSLSEQVGERMRAENFMFKCVSITIRDQSFFTFTRSHIQDRYSILTEDIYRASTDLFIKNWNGAGIRLVGLSVSHLCNYTKAYQLNLFYDRNQKLEKLNLALDSIRKKHGPDSIVRAPLMSGRIKQMAPLWGMKNFDPSPS